MTGETPIDQVASPLPLGAQLIESVKRAEAPSSQLLPFLHDLGHGVVERVVHIPQGVADLVTHRHSTP